MAETAPSLTVADCLPHGAAAYNPSLVEAVLAFRQFGTPTECYATRCATRTGPALSVPTMRNEFWTSKQRAVNSLHEISYRACFKAQLPRFFIEKLTQPGERVYDPFMGRGTTLLEAALLGRVPLGCDINPLSIHLIRPRLRPPTEEAVRRRLGELDFRDAGEMPEDLLVFYHPSTLRQISALRKYLQGRKEAGLWDPVDDWIALVALNRLTGHSAGFFSVYTLPPNQAVSVKSQRRINERRGQTPPRRDVPEILLKKTRNLLSQCREADRQMLEAAGGKAVLLTRSAAATPELAAGSVDLVVTSPPFLKVVDYATDNWLRCWFLGIDARTVPLTVPARLEAWEEAMTAVFAELARVVRPGGAIAFEVGEVNCGNVPLEESVVRCADAVGLAPELIMINAQRFTKTANCWGVDNNQKGTNSNRIVVLRRSAGRA